MLSSHAAEFVGCYGRWAGRLQAELVDSIAP